MDAKALYQTNQHLIKRSRGVERHNNGTNAGRERSRSANILKLKKTVGKSKAKVFGSGEKSST